MRIRLGAACALICLLSLSGAQAARKKKAPPKKRDWIFGANTAIGFPHLITVQGAANFVRFGAAVEYGTFYRGYQPRTLDSKVRFGISNFGGVFRWFPFAGAFTVGAGIGSESYFVSGQKSFTFKISGVELAAPVDFSLSYRRMYLTPHIGFFGAFSFGLTLGFELGIEAAPFGGSITAECSIPQSTLDGFPTIIQAEISKYCDDPEANVPGFSDIKSQAETAINSALSTYPVWPYVTLLRIGWMF